MRGYVGNKPPYGYRKVSYKEGKRTCYTLELDPVYADVIINRWEEATGERAERISGI